MAKKLAVCGNGQKAKKLSPCDCIVIAYKTPEEISKFINLANLWNNMTPEEKSMVIKHINVL